MILNKEKFELISKLKNVSFLLEVDSWEFAQDLGYDNILCQDDFYKLYERGGDGIGEKLKSVWNFISMKGSKLRNLGKQLENAIRIKLNSVLLAKEKINNLDNLDPNQKIRILNLAKEKEKSAIELQDTIKEKMDAIADGDSRLEKIASIAKSNANIKPQKEKIQLISKLEYADETLKKEKEKLKKIQDETREKSNELNDMLQELKKRESEKQKKNTNTNSDEKNKTNSEEKNPNEEKIVKLNDANNKLKDEINKFKDEIVSLTKKLDINSANYTDPNGSNSRKLKDLEKQKADRELILLQNKIQILRYKDSDKESIKKVQDLYNKKEEKFNKKFKINTKN